MTDPFATPVAVASTHPSADSFRGRLVLIEPTGIEFDVLKNSKQPNGAKGNKITATVTVVDGSGPVQIYREKVPTGAFLDGPVFHGVWFNQDRLALLGGLINPQTKTLVPLVLGRLETFKPGQPQGLGNPWGLLEPTEEDKQTARNFLAGQTMAKVAGPAAASDNPFNK